jgi:hypothetical protein
MKEIILITSSNKNTVYGITCFDALFHSLLKASPEQAPVGRASKPAGRIIHDSFMNNPG